MDMFDTYRIQSVLEASTLDVDIENVSAFDLKALDIEAQNQPILPSNLRLGHVIEKIVGHLIKSSKNYAILFENLQIREGKQTRGELDFIILEKTKNQTIHLEIAYKFYLLDPRISPKQTHCWIGPNRRDSFAEKTGKLADKQFSILYQEVTKTFLKHIDVNAMKQQLCFMASLYLPIDYKGQIEPRFQGAIKGYYMPYQFFLESDHSQNQYHIPHKKIWGIAPKYNSHWASFEAIKPYLGVSMSEQQAPLVWVKTEAGFEEVFLVWW
jgi:hypothetical protein